MVGGGAAKALVVGVCGVCTAELWQAENTTPPVSRFRGWVGYASLAVSSGSRRWAASS